MPAHEAMKQIALPNYADRLYNSKLRAIKTAKKLQNGLRILQELSR